MTRSVQKLLLLFYACIAVLFDTPLVKKNESIYVCITGGYAINCIQGMLT